MGSFINVCEEKSLGYRYWARIFAAIKAMCKKNKPSLGSKVCLCIACVSYHSIEGESGDGDVLRSTVDVKVLAAGIGFNVAWMVCLTNKLITHKQGRCATDTVIQSNYRLHLHPCLFHNNNNYCNNLKNLN